MADELIPLRSLGKLDGRLDPERLYLVIKEGRRKVIYDLRATAEQRRAVIVSGEWPDYENHSQLV